jgi:hypothetical protein
MITSNESHHSPLIAGELDITVTAYAPTSAKPPGEVDTLNPTPTQTITQTLQTTTNNQIYLPLTLLIAVAAVFIAAVASLSLLFYRRNLKAKP